MSVHRGSSGSPEVLDPSWITLQRAVAICMIIVLAIPMIVFVEQVIPPLGIASILFGLAFVGTWIRPREAAIGIGIVSSFWLVTQVANYQQVVPDLLRPEQSLFFLTAVGMIAFSAAGVIGLIGVVKSISGNVAIRTLQMVGLIMVGSLLFSILSSL